jgi:nucleotide-binding universal stress UspA family protein
VVIEEKDRNRLPGLVPGRGTVRRISHRVTAVHGFPVEELIKAASDADMIVLGSRGAGGFTRLLMGSVAGPVAQHAHCPVLIVPPEDRG